MIGGHYLVLVLCWVHWVVVHILLELHEVDFMCTLTQSFNHCISLYTRLFLHFSIHSFQFRSQISANALLKDNKAEVLMNRWRNPSLSIHGIEGAYSSPGAKTVIPSKVSNFIKWKTGSRIYFQRYRKCALIGCSATGLFDIIVWYYIY